MDPLVAFLVTAVVIGLFLWALGRFPINPMVMNVITVVCVVVLVVMALNLLLTLLFGHGLPHYLGSGMK